MRVEISLEVIDDLQQEVRRSVEKHGDHAQLNPCHPLSTYMANLGEEFGEVFRACTYDQQMDLYKELIQCAAMAMSWGQVIADNALNNIYTTEKDQTKEIIPKKYVLLDKLYKKAKIMRSVAVVDDDFPRVMYEFDSALAAVERYMKSGSQK